MLAFFYFFVNSSLREKLKFCLKQYNLCYGVMIQTNVMVLFGYLQHLVSKQYIIQIRKKSYKSTQGYEDNCFYNGKLFSNNVQLKQLITQCRRNYLKMSCSGHRLCFSSFDDFVHHTRTCTYYQNCQHCGRPFLNTSQWVLRQHALACYNKKKT